MAGRKTVNKERIAHARKELEALAAILGEILDDNMTQADAARKLGITPQEFRNETIGNFTNYVKKRNILTEDNLITYLKDIETPLERLVRDIFCIEDKNKLLVIEMDNPEDFIETMKDALTEKEFYVLSLHYGFEGKPMTYQEIGEQIGTQRAQPGVIVNKALRKLRHPCRSKRLFPNYAKYTKALKEYRTAERIYEKMEVEYVNAVTASKWMLHNIKLAETAPKMIEDFEKLLYLKDIPEISKDWVKAFEDVGVISVFDYLNIEEEKLKYVKDKCMGFSVNKINEILDIKEKISRDDFCLMRLPLEETDINVRTYNALRRSGIHTLGQLTELTEDELKKIRNFGAGCMLDVKQLLDEHHLCLADK